jgi:predicted nucleic acid-binding Zn ribbon protein
MEHFGKVLEDFLKDLGVGKNIKRYEAFKIWNQVVGKKISDVTEPVRIVNGKIFVKVKKDTWRNELIYQKQKIVNALNDQLGSKIIKDIVLI